MTKLTPPLFLATLLALALHSAPAQALNARSFISALGNDANPCTRPLPCRTLQGAHDKTAAGGEINMLDPAGYGVVTINKSISIINDGVGSAGVLVPSAGTGITINAGASDVINLRGLIIEGAGVGPHGIIFNSGGALQIQNCVVRGLTGYGIYFAPNTTGTSAYLAVSNSYIASTDIGISVTPSGSGSTQVDLNRVEMRNHNTTGFYIDGSPGTGTIAASLTDNLSSKSFYGITVISDTGQAHTQIMVTRSVTSNNNVGLLFYGANVRAQLAQSTVTGNANGYFITVGATLESYGDNYIDGNGGAESGASPISKK
jgi:hypothetical protein